MKKWFKVGLAVLSTAALLLAGCGGEKKADKPAAATDKMKVAFVYVGPAGDAGWSYSHDQGRKYLLSKMPDVETTVVESVPEGADAERVINNWLRKAIRLSSPRALGTWIRLST